MQHLFSLPPSQQQHRGLLQLVRAVSRILRWIPSFIYTRAFRFSFKVSLLFLLWLLFGIPFLYHFISPPNALIQWIILSTDAFVFCQIYYYSFWTFWYFPVCINDFGSYDTFVLILRWSYYGKSYCLSIKIQCFSMHKTVTSLCGTAK